VELLPDLRKHKALPESALAGLERRAWLARLEAGAGDAANLWQSLPSGLRHDEALISAHARQLLQANQVDAAEEFVRKALARDWAETLVDLYGRIVSSDVKRQLATAESWLKQRPNDPFLLLTLGRISRMNELWSKAVEYFEESHRQQHSAAACAELGVLLNALGETARATRYLLKAVADGEQLPLPGSVLPGNDQPGSDQVRGA